MASGGIGALTVSLGLDAAEFTNGLTKAQQQAQAFSASVKSIAAGTAIGNAIGDFAREAATRLKEMTVGVIDAADHLNDLSKQTGIAVTTLGGIGFAAGQAGGDLESASAAAGKLNKSLAEAASGNKEAAGAFKALGINIKDATGNTKTADVALVELADKFASYEDGPEKAALALKLFGKAGAAIIPLLDDGGRSLQENIAYYKRFSGVTAETAAASDEFNDTLGKLKLLSGAFGQTLVAELLGPLQHIADLFLTAKENGDQMKGVATTLVDIFKGLALGAAFLAESLIAASAKLAQFAAQATVLADVAEASKKNAGPLDLFGTGNYFSELKKAVPRMAAINDASKEAIDQARKNVVDFHDALYKPGKGKSTDPADFAVLDQVSAKKRPAPKLADTAGQAEASAALKKQLDGQLKVIDDFGKAQQDAYKTGQSYVEGVYQDALISQREFFDAQKRVRDASLQSQLDTFDKEIAAQRAFIANPLAKPSDRVSAEEKIRLAVQQRGEAVTKASAADILASQSNARAIADLADQYVNLSATILANTGDTFGAQALRNAQQVAAAAKVINQIGGDPAVTDKLAAQLDLQNQAAQQQKEYAKLLDDTARNEAALYLEAQSGGRGELEVLASIRDARQQAIVQLQAQADAAAKLASISGTDADAKRAADLSLAVKKAAADIDPLATKFNNLFEDSFTNAFSGFLAGTKSAKDAFKGFASSVIGEIANIAAKNLAKSLFGDTGGSSGIGGFLSSLFKSNSGGTGFGTGSNFGNQDLGAFLATGTNSIPYDGFQATLHKGEAVVPAKYNPANGASSGTIQIVNNLGVQATARQETQQQPDGSQLKRIVLDAVAGDVGSGTGRVSTALKGRHGTGAGNLPRRN